jgi:hypothetical protein
MDIAWLVWTLNSSDTTVGQIITSQVSFRKLLAILSSLFRYRVSDDLLVQSLDDLLKNAAKVEDKRNTFIHSVWFVDNSGTSSRVKLTVRQKHGFQIQNEDVDDKRLNEFADELLGLADEFVTFCNGLYEKQIISSKPGIST